ncbi:MAG: SMC-Scp complex subunit ScpB [Acidobacteriaceae bacterium]
MSLKARIEAVIYAAEEPVTLAQLASLFRDEALAGRAERIPPQADPEAPAEDLLAEVGGEPAEEPAASPAPEAPATETLDPIIPPIPSTQEEPTTVAADPVSELAASDATASFPDVLPEGATGAGLPSAAQAAGSEAADDAKKAARTRDREARDEIRRLIDELIADYASADRGLEIREVAGGFRMATRAEYHDAVRAFVKSLKPPMKLSLQALETLAVIAYKQPVTAPEIGEIRGVDSAGVLGSLISRKLITTAGRKQVIGRPILYKTTKEFLLRFGLKDLNELPSIEEFEKMATELAESEEDVAASATEELPFAQNEIADLEDAAEGDGEGDPPSAPEPLQDPTPDVPEPPIGEPTPEEDPASGPSGGDPPPPPQDEREP